MHDNTRKSVVYYPGCYANYLDPEIGKAVVRILERNGFSVIVPKHRCCGIARMGCGDLNNFLKEAKALIYGIFDLASPDYDIVTACPSCSLALKEEYPFLLHDEKVDWISENTWYFSTYINELHNKGEFNTDLNPIPLSVTYHLPCHLKAQGGGVDSVRMMRLIPELRVTELDRGCCGMHGTAGFKRQYFEYSMAIGSKLSARIEELGTDLVVTDCGGCQLQIETIANTNVIHPAVLLNKAY
jgi:Fe-S oxidoreductase